MYQKRKIRAEKKNNDSQKSFPSVGINWYPGHMAKTKRQISEDIKLIDIIIEILDSRICQKRTNRKKNKSNGAWNTKCRKIILYK